MEMMQKWTRYCGGSRALAWGIAVMAATWLVVAMVSVAAHWLHFNTGIEQWFTLQGYFPAFLTRPWTLVTYMAIHFDVLHVLFNLLWLYWFGKVHLLDGTDRQLAVYFLGGGVAGGLFFLAASAMGMGGGWLCGCSAAVIAVMCGAAVKHPDLEFRLFLIGNLKLKWIALLCCVLTFMGGGGNLAAHIGGLAWGLAAAFIRIPARRGERHSSNTARRRADKVVKAMADHRRNMERLDQLLDKIKVSGYESLSAKERNELVQLSARITKKT